MKWRDDIKPDATASACMWCMDGTPSERRQGKGYSWSLCRSHRERLERNGHPAKPSYSAAQLKPYVKLARRFIVESLGPEHAVARPTVRHVVREFALTVESSTTDPSVIPKGARAQVRAALARMKAKYLTRNSDEHRQQKTAKIDSEELGIRLAANVVGVRLAHRHDPEPTDERFLKAQIGRRIHRLAGGHVRVWPVGGAREGERVTHVFRRERYPDCAGQTRLELGFKFLDREFISGAHEKELDALVAQHVPESPIMPWTQAFNARAGGKVAESDPNHMTERPTKPKAQYRYGAKEVTQEVRPAKSKRKGKGGGVDDDRVGGMPGWWLRGEPKPRGNDRPEPPRKSPEREPEG